MWVNNKSRNHGKLQLQFVLSCDYDVIMEGRKVNANFRKQIEKKKKLFFWKIFYCIEISLLQVFFLNFQNTFWKKNVLNICISIKKPKVSINYFQNLLLAKVFRIGWMKQTYQTEPSSVSLYWARMFPNQSKTLSKVTK